MSSVTMDVVIIYITSQNVYFSRLSACMHRVTTCSAPFFISSAGKGQYEEGNGTAKREAAFGDQTPIA